MDGKIALEEHWAIDETLHIAGQPFGAGAFWDETRRLLVDFRERRLADMDANGIELAILGLNSPGLQAILDPVEASNVARRANDILAGEIARSPGRFAGFAGLPMRDPEAAALELIRCVTELGFKGALVNCFTQRHVKDSAVYYDLPEFRPFWATVAELDVPFYLHPRLIIHHGRCPMKGIAGSTVRSGISEVKLRLRRCG
jgi:gamma-resorcylate decarboxylase